MPELPPVTSAVLPRNENSRSMIDIASLRQRF
jgi:hypothetical protein